MAINIMAIAINLRSHNAPKVQEILTKYGCVIKTRLGIHETSENNCSEEGVVILHLKDDKKIIDELKAELTKIDGVRLNVMEV